MRFPLILPVLFAVAVVGVAHSAEPITAQEVIDRIKQHVGVPWREQTVDTFKAGDPQTPVTGIAVTMMSTMDVLKRASAEGKNLVISHEPTFYGHQDRLDDLKNEGDAIAGEKLRFIQQHHMVVWRFHDHWHAMTPDGIQTGMTQALEWDRYQRPEDQHLYTLPETTLGELAATIKKRLKIRVMRVVGDPKLKIKGVAMAPGAGGFVSHRKFLQRPDVQALVIGEAAEWETVEYVDDATAQARPKGLIILGHIPSEQAGMEYCAKWLKGFVSEAPIGFVPTAEPFWSPDALPKEKR